MPPLSFFSFRGRLAAKKKKMEFRRQTANILMRKRPPNTKHKISLIACNRNILKRIRFFFFSYAGSHC